ncbi:MAG TPA: 2-oxo-4-hydroxy-4-carboxy-5-ureidoimidazoline decarboxylase [Candidatus Limnocylindrales bacterium]
MAAPSIARLNAMPPDEAAAFLELLFEAAPRFIARLVRNRPFADEAELFARAEALALRLPADEAIELVNAHPRLGAPRASVSRLSAREQGYDGPGDGQPPTLAERLEALNRAYEDRFGFRYCVFVNGRSREALIPEWEERVARGDRPAELDRARRDVVAIGRDRYRRLTGDVAERREVAGRREEATA